MLCNYPEVTSYSLDDSSADSFSLTEMSEHCQRQGEFITKQVVLVQLPLALFGGFVPLDVDGRVHLSRHFLLERPEAVLRVCGSDAIYRPRASRT